MPRLQRLALLRGGFSDYRLMERRFPRAALILIAALLTGCGRPPDLVGIDNPAVPAASVAGATDHRVFLVTTREASEVSGAFYGPRRAPEVALASVDVSVPPNH